MKNNKLILLNLKEKLQIEFGNSIEVILFGSQAKGNAGENSDYDILIILNKDHNWEDENKILDICYDIDLKYNIIIDAHILSKNELTAIRGKQPIFINAINSGIYA